MLRPVLGLILSDPNDEIEFRLGLAVMASEFVRDAAAGTGESDADIAPREDDTGESDADTGDRVDDMGENDADTGDRVADMGESEADTGGRVADDETVLLIRLRGFSFDNSGANRASSNSGDASNWQVALAVRLLVSVGCGVSSADCDWQNDLIRVSAEENAI